MGPGGRHSVSNVRLGHLKFILLLISASFVVGHLIASQVSRSSLSLPQKLDTSANRCPLKTPQDWQNFLESASDSPKWVATCEDSTCDASFYQHVKEDVQSIFEKCASFISSHPEIARCTLNLKKFTPAWMRQHDSYSYGFTIDNALYLKDQDNPRRPSGMMIVPDAIVKALPDRNKVEEVARQNGWQYLTHDSALSGSRTFVLIRDPKGRFDTWMLLNLQGSDATLTDSQPLSVLAVQKADVNGKPLEKVQLHFRDYTLKKSDEGYRLALYTDNNGKCYGCHPNGVRQLIARRTPILYSKPSRGEEGFNESGEIPANSDFAYRRLMEFNRRLRSYGSPDWEGKIVPADHGPALGEAQGCTECHNGRIRASLNLSTSHVQLEQKVLKELTMPTDNQWPRLLEKSQMRSAEMTPEDRAALERAYGDHREILQDFEASRFPTLKAWMLESPCK